jgi:hypothetical protein
MPASPRPLRRFAVLDAYTGRLLACVDAIDANDARPPTGTSDHQPEERIDHERNRTCIAQRFTEI